VRWWHPAEKKQPLRSGAKFSLLCFSIANKSASFRARSARG
jgi:hypothetical protein